MSPWLSPPQLAWSVLLLAASPSQALSELPWHDRTLGDAMAQPSRGAWDAIAGRLEGSPQRPCAPVGEIPTAGLNLTAEERDLLPYLCWQPEAVPYGPGELPVVGGGRSTAVPAGVQCEVVQWCAPGLGPRPGPRTEAPRSTPGRSSGWNRLMFAELCRRALKVSAVVKSHIALLHRTAGPCGIPPRACGSARVSQTL